MKKINRWELVLLCTMLIIKPICSMGGTNHVTNGSFEINSNIGLADGWGSGGWGLKSLEAINQSNKIRQRFFVETTTNAVDGDKVFKIINPNGKKTLSLVSTWINFPRFIVAKNGWSISAYLKSKPMGTIKIELLNSKYKVIAQHKFNVSNQWQRYSFSVNPKVSPVVIKISPTAGTICEIDAVQFTPGSPSEKWSHAKYDTILDIATTQPRQFFSNVKVKNRHYDAVKKVKIKNNWVTVNEKAFFPYSIMMQSRINLKFLKKLKQTGFNTVNFYAITLEQTKRELDMAYQAGLRAVPWLHCKPAKVAQIIKQLKNHPALITWLVIDEPPNPFAKNVIKRAAAVRQFDAKRPLWINYRTKEIKRFSKNLSALPGDIISADWYPIADRNYPAEPCSPALLISKMVNKLRNANKVTWFALQLCGYAFMFQREPTPEEFEAMVYSAVIAGSKGLFFFQNVPWNARLMKIAGEIGSEIDFLTPILAYGTPISVKSSNKQIMITAKYYKNNIYIIAVNTSPKNINVNLKIGENLNTTKAKVLFENRTINVSKNSFNDKFESYQRHVYFCKMSP